MAELDAVQIQFEDDSPFQREPISVYELTRYLHHFRAAYATAATAARRAPEERDTRQSSHDALTEYVRQIDSFAHQLRVTLRKSPPDSIDALAETPLPVELVITQISYNSPLQLVFGGSIVALVAAIILSGGEITVSQRSLHAKLPPIGTGIVKLREAFNVPLDPSREKRKIKAKHD